MDNLAPKKLVLQLIELGTHKANLKGKEILLKGSWLKENFLVSKLKRCWVFVLQRNLFGGFFMSGLSLNYLFGKMDVDTLLIKHVLEKQEKVNVFYCIFDYIESIESC